MAKTRRLRPSRRFNTPTGIARTKERPHTNGLDCWCKPDILIIPPLKTAGRPN